MSRTFLVVVVLVLMTLHLQSHAADNDAIYGFTSESAKAERQWESKFKELPSPKVMRDTMQRLSARPHHVGSAYDKENAEWILSQFKSWGLDAHIETFKVLFPTPKERVVEMVAPKVFKAALKEPVVAGDPTSDQQAEQLPTYNAYSIDGDVTAPLVYVNFGIPKDYETLERLGVSVKGAIVIARYGNSWRGIKPKVAAEHGAIGCIIYSDPHEDGYAVEDVFPRGPMCNENGAHRGSVQDMPLYPGDPLTPGVGATEDATRLAVKDALTLTKIPVLPISYSDAKPLLEAIGGGGARGLARRVADHVSRGARTGEGPSEGGIELGAQADQRRDREDSRIGGAGSVGDPGESSRCLGEWGGRSHFGTGLHA